MGPSSLIKLIIRGLGISGQQAYHVKVPFWTRNGQAILFIRIQFIRIKTFINFRLELEHKTKSSHENFSMKGKFFKV